MKRPTCDCLDCLEHWRVQRIRKGVRGTWDYATMWPRLWSVKKDGPLPEETGDEE